MKIRVFAFLLTMLMTISLITSCASTDPQQTQKPDSNNNSSDANDDNPSSPDAPTTSVEDTLNFDFDYDGGDFNILLASVPTRTPDDFNYGSDLTEVMDEAIYRRNNTMLQDYNVKIVCTKDLGSSNLGYEKFHADYTSSNNNYQLGVISGYDAAELALVGALFDFKSLPNINTANTWWDQAAERDLRIADALFFTTGAISTVMDDYTYCVVFNKDLYNITIGNQLNVYDLVKEDKWTLDKLAELSRTIKVDVNGDDKMDSRDRYGLMIWDNEMIASINAAGEKIASINENGMAQLTLYNEKVNTVVNKFVTMGNSDYCINFQHMSGGVQFYDMFTQNQVLFFMSMFNEVERFRDMRTDYGILPNPKLNESDPYFAPVSPWHSAFLCVESTIEDEEEISTVIELLGYHSEKIITPAYYDKTLIGKYTRDDESVEMLDLIFANRVYDVGHLYRIATFQEHVTNLLRNNNPGGLSSMYENYIGTATSDIDQLNFDIAILKSQQQKH